MRHFEFALEHLSGLNLLLVVITVEWQGLEVFQHPGHRAREWHSPSVLRLHLHSDLLQQQEQQHQHQQEEGCLGLLLQLGLELLAPLQVHLELRLVALLLGVLLLPLRSLEVLLLLLPLLSSEQLLLLLPLHLPLHLLKPAAAVLWGQRLLLHLFLALHRLLLLPPFSGRRRLRPHFQ